ncbi:MAG: hypothetical protein JWN40_4645 [Phycisphaerales bacterium]|nr:hypothetical protein [Phycisphaerales bacterium]
MRILTPIVLLTFSTIACAADKPKPVPTTQPNAVAVIELFTSEGCSSCPPADALLAEILRDARAKNQPIYPLAFHVDYWDRLGWRDPYSNPAHSARQRAYSQSFHRDSIYTPQMIINGVTEFVGSDRTRATQELAKALEQPAKVTVKLTVAPGKKPNALTVTYDLNPLPKSAQLHIALVERNLQTKVLRGENAARTLSHDNVVRAFESIPLEKSQGQLDVTLPLDLKRQNASIIGYVQNQTMHTLGATGRDLAPE